jgi:peptidoglycan/LPS O-acetylase OafA/YrhL
MITENSNPVPETLKAVRWSVFQGIVIDCIVFISIVAAAFYYRLYEKPAQHASLVRCAQLYVVAALVVNVLLLIRFYTQCKKLLEMGSAPENDPVIPPMGSPGKYPHYVMLFLAMLALICGAIVVYNYSMYNRSNFFLYSLVQMGWSYGCSICLISTGNVYRKFNRLFIDASHTIHDR